ncbi:MAG: 4a-hydroxytetrahydrobiopterin dehydratase [Candidatus Omnitrophica bacterium]|nr:4a-hydroxytetrahydrobiopterin dehydratase [Candidatus Omnitrophota bacterium]
MAEELAQKKCVPCEGGTTPMSSEEANRYISQVMGWQIIEDKKIKKEFKFKDFKGSLDFVNKVGALAEQEQHHPNITIIYNKVNITLSTHAIGGLSQNDFIMAAKINQIDKRNEDNKS